MSRETPPRTWRRLIQQTEDAINDRNTSTDVEKTNHAVLRRPRREKHLHGRGEDHLAAENRADRVGNTSTDVEKTVKAKVCADMYPETPPRTWRRRIILFPCVLFRRNTSTDVEKTAFDQQSVRQIEKHLHGRGEDISVLLMVLSYGETPPRTWRRLDLSVDLLFDCRNTSTDVEKTNSWTLESRSLWKHLHGRGEDDMEVVVPCGKCRNTSTDVEKT